MAIGKDILAAMAIRIGIDSANFSKSLNKIQGDMNIWKSGLKELGKVVAGVFAVDTLVEFGKESFREYQNQFQQEKLLLTALKGRKDIQERLIQQAGYLQKTTLFTDDEIITQQKLLASLGFTEKQIRQVIDAATNLSTALGVGLDQSVLMLSKTFNGSTRELGRLIPEIKNMTKEQLAAGDAVKWVNENMRGLAETAANTDPIKQMSKAWAELKESFGKAIAPAVTNFAQKGSKEFTIWGSQDLSFWQKASQLFNKKRTDELYNYVVKLEEVRNKENETIADNVASFKSVTQSVESEAEARKRLKAQMDAMAAARKAEFNIQANRELTALFAATETGLKPKGAQVSNPNLPKAPISDLGTTSKWEQNYALLKANMEKMKSLVQQETAIINEAFAGVAVGFGEALGQMVATGAGFNWGMIVSPIADAMSSLGKLIITASIAIGTLKKTLVKWATANPVLGVIAGTALIAAAAAIKAGVSNSINGIASGGSGSMSMSSGGTTTETFHRNLGDLQPIRVEVTGTISGDVIRLANKRATDKHVNGY